MRAPHGTFWVCEDCAKTCLSFLKKPNDEERIVRNIQRGRLGSREMNYLAKHPQRFPALFQRIIKRKEQE